MEENLPRQFALIAGRGVYPRLLAESARRQGVDRIFAIAFKRETERAIGRLVDEIRWMSIGQFSNLLDALRESGMKHVVMAGLITPSSLFHVRPDARALAILTSLPQKNAHSIFGAVVDEIRNLGMDVLPASAFMASHMPGPGLLTARAPTDLELRDVGIGVKVARLVSDIDIGQTVVIKGGAILAVEAFEGTDETIRRAGRIGGDGAVVVKLAKRGHDMRFDIPVVGLNTLAVLNKAGARVLAVQAGRAIVLEKEKVIAKADKMGLCITVLPPPEGQS